MKINRLTFRDVSQHQFSSAASKMIFSTNFFSIGLFLCFTRNSTLLEFNFLEFICSLSYLYFSHRAPDYFAESIRSVAGFWGWQCQSYLYYLLGICKPTAEGQIIAGEDARSSSTGVYFLSTNPISPFALGRITELIQTKSIHSISFDSVRNVDPFLREIDDFGKLQGNFNNLPHPKFFDDNESFFSNRGSDELTHNYIDRLRNRFIKEGLKHTYKKAERLSSKLTKDQL